MPTRRQKAFLHQLWFRESGAYGAPCWVVNVGGGRYVLLVKTMMGTWERHSHVALHTLRILHAAGHIEYGEAGPMPAWFTPRAGEESVGRELTITDKGRQIIGKDTN